jgi:2-desacetyl-2-hydroxyethyl bacteriochlorophyllide A dehydrogenase
VKAVVWNGPNDMTLESLETPRASAGAVIVEPRATGICGSDLIAYQGHMGVSNPGQVRGHEFAGLVVETDPQDAAWLGLPVVVNPLVSCGQCRACVRRADNQCARQATLGILSPGSLAERVGVPVRNLIALAPQVDLRAAAGAEPLAQAVHDVRVALRDRPAETTLVIGAGSIGLLVVQAARQLGIGHIAVLEPNSRRHALIRAAGADSVFSDRAEADDLANAGRSGDLGFDVVFDLVGIAATRQDAVTWTGRGGTAMFVGLHSDSTPITWRDALRREITIRATNASDQGDFITAVEWITEGSVQVPMPQLRALDDTPEIFRALAEGAASNEKVLIGQ